MNKWISVKDRLPEKEEMVLLRIIDFIPEDTKNIYYATLTGLFYQNKFRSFCPCKIHNKKCFDTEYEITHWMPLPSPPE